MAFMPQTITLLTYRFPDNEPSIEPKSLCLECQNEVFNDQYTEELRTVWRRVHISTPERIHAGSRSINRIYRSAGSGCVWCTKILDIIYTAEVERIPANFGTVETLLEEDATLRLHYRIGSRDISHNGEMYFYLVRINQDGKVDGELEIVFAINTKPDISEDLPFPRLEHGIDMGAEECFVSIRNFISHCRAAHCQDKDLKTLTITERPSRLIDSLNMNLVDGIGAQAAAEYITLSYVWGLARDHRLTEEKLPLLRDQLDVSILPKTIQQAIEVTKRLGYRYLWVDALCIIQDSDDDKSRELSKMHSIYKNAALTIVAGNAADAGAGFLNTCDLQHPSSKFCTITAGSGPAALDVLIGFRVDYDFLIDPINERAWTLQEYVLSRHPVVYSNEGIAVICRDLQTNTPSDAPMLQQLNIFSRNFWIDRTEDWANPMKAWQVLVNDYSTRLLSDSNDKLTAIGAVAEEIFRHLPATKYLAGLWEHDLLHQLLWRASGEMGTRPGVDRAPSWTWATIDRSVELPTERTRARPYSAAAVLSHQVELRHTDNPFGAVIYGHLELSGRCLDVPWVDGVPRFDQALLTDAPSQALYAEPKRFYFHPDSTKDDFEGPYVVCLALSVTSRVDLLNGEDIVNGLILGRVNSKSYRRIGVFLSLPEVWFRDQPVRILTLE